jgi:hypothetical protein
VIARIRALAPTSQLILALAVAVLIGAVVTLVPGALNVGTLLACFAILATLAAVTQWLWQNHHGTDWANAFTDTKPARGADPRVSRLAARVDAAVAGDAVAQTELHDQLRTLAEDRLRSRHGIVLDGDADHVAQAKAALGPDLTAYLTNPPTTRLDHARVIGYLTTLEEL